MKKLTTLSITSLCLIFLSLASCETESDRKTDATLITPIKVNTGSVSWLRRSDSTGGSHQDTLLVRYAPRDCTYAPITVMFISDSTGGSHQDTTYVQRVVLKPQRKIFKRK